MNRNALIVLSVIVVIAIIAVAVFSNKKKVNEDYTPTFESIQDAPYGTRFVLQEIEKNIFNKHKVEKVHVDFYTKMDDNEIKNTNYIIICKVLDMGEEDMRTMLNYVANGNNVFIATESIPYLLEDTLGFYYNTNYLLSDINVNNPNTTKSYIHKFLHPQMQQPDTYAFKRNLFQTTIHIEDTAFFKLLAKNQNNEPIFASTKYGNGTIYLHSYPYCFSNYYLLYKNNSEYISKCLSMMPNQKTYWDEYYKKEKSDNDYSSSNNPIQFILKTPALRWAWYVMLISMLFYILFRIKRQQRIIPIVKPYENSSLQFIKTIGRLYFNKGDHNDISKKQITYWLEYIRSKLYINTNKLDKEFIQNVSDKSGIDKSYIESIILHIGDMRNRYISKNDVITLYQKLNYFYKNSKR